MIVKVVLLDHDVLFHVITIVRAFIAILFITVFIITLGKAEEDISDGRSRIGKNTPMFLAITHITVSLVIHINVSNSSLSASCRGCLSLFLFFLIFPHLLDAFGELLMHWNFHISILLDKDNTIVEVVMFQSNTEGRIAIDIL